MSDAWSRTALIAASVLIVVAPLPFGATGPIPQALLAFSLALGILALLLRHTSALPPLRFAVLTLLTLGLAAIFWIPLPPGARATVAPRLVEQARLSLAAPGAEPALVHAEEQLAALSGGTAAAPGWRPLAADLDSAIMGTTRLLLTLAAFLLGLLAAGENRKSRRYLAGALALSALFQTIYGLAESLSGSSSIFGWRNIYYPGTAFGTFICPNHFASLVSLGIFALAGLMALAEQPLAASEPDQPWDRFGVLARRATGLTILGLFAIGLLWSSSRGALAAGTVGVLGLMILLLTFEPERRPPAVFLIIGLVGVVGLAAGAFWVRPAQSLITDVQQSVPGLAGRRQLWSLALETWRSSPLLGTGPGTFRVVHALYRPTSLAAAADHAHSDYLEVLAEMGIIGGLLLAAWLVCIAGRTWALFRRGTDRALTAALALGLLALAIQEVAEFSLQIPGAAVPIALITGAMLAPLSWNPEPARPGALPRPGLWRFALLVLLTGLLATGTLTLLASRTPDPSGSRPALPTPEQLRLWSDGKIQNLITAAQAGRPLGAPEKRQAGEAWLAAREAAQRAPLQADMQVTLWTATQLLAGLQPTDSQPTIAALAQHYLARAEALDPASRPRCLQLIRCQLAAGDKAGARHTIRRLLEMSPHHFDQAFQLIDGANLELADLMEAIPNQPTAVYNLAKYLIARGDWSGTQIVLERASSRFPKATSLKRLLAWVLTVRGRAADALAALEKLPVQDSPEELTGRLQVKAEALASLGRLDEAEKVLGELEHRQVDRRSLTLAWARILSARGDHQRAIQRIEGFLAADGARLPDHDRLALFLMLGQEQHTLGRIPEALDTFRKAQAIEPENPEVQQFFARLEKAGR